MNRDLLLAILAMDSYNRGYGQGITGLDETGQFGNVTIRDFRIGEQAGWQAAGFYAIAYQVPAGAADGIDTSTTVISYRGTDNNLGTFFGAGGSDLVNGYGLSVGAYGAPQVYLAIKFYQEFRGRNT